MRTKCCSALIGIVALFLVAASSPKDYVITNSGAVGDGQTLNTQAIQSLIDRIASTGGGTVVVPEGDFLSGALSFKQGVNLRIEKNGILKGSTRPSDYPQIDTRWEGTERKWTSAFLNFDHMTDVLVAGDGMVDGQGDIWMTRGGFGGRGRRGATSQLTQATRPTTRLAGPGRPRLICFSNCQHVRIADLHLQKQAVWCLHILYSQNVEVENLNINAIARIPSSDGIDVDSSNDVHISKCEIACNDDNIAIKSGKDADGLRVNRPSENITISDCIMGVGGGICMGSEVSGGIRNVVVQRCTLNETDSAARFKSQPSRGGVIEHIIFRDITLNNVRQMIDCNMEWRMVGPPLPPANPLTLMHDIHLENFTGTARTGGIIHGLKDGPVQDLTFENCNITAQSGLRIENAKNLNLTGLHLNIPRGAPTTSPTSQPTN